MSKEITLTKDNTLVLDEGDHVWVSVKSRNIGGTILELPSQWKESARIEVHMVNNHVRLNGVIKDEEDASNIPDATVTIYSGSDGLDPEMHPYGEVYQTTTDNNGFFQIEIPATSTSATIEIKHPNYERHIESIVPTWDQTVNVNMRRFHKHVLFFLRSQFFIY